jgi:hypothetical protein
MTWRMREVLRLIGRPTWVEALECAGLLLLGSVVLLALCAAA